MTATVVIKAVPLAEASDARRFGAKAANLAVALRAGLAVPDGWVLAPTIGRQLVDGAQAGGVLADLIAHVGVWGVPLAVRSSAIGEDGAVASFAGQHVTRLGVRATEGALRAAIAAVAASAGSPHALAYRRALAAAVRTDGALPVAILIQPLVDAQSSGVMFTRDPVTGADELVVEAAHGLGESVVGGRVTPELWRMRRDGVVTHRRRGRQAVAIVAAPSGGTEERPLDPARAAGPCLEPGALRLLARLAANCRRVFDLDALNIEWALSAGGAVALLQCRPVTVRPSVAHPEGKCPRSDTFPSG